MIPRKNLFKLIVPFLTVLLLAVPVLYMGSTTKQFGDDLLGKAKTMGGYGLETLLWLASAWLMTRALDVFLWDGFFLNRRKVQVAKLLKDVVAFQIFLLAVAGIMGVVFKIPLTGFLATSGAVGIVIGLALNKMISDVFSGIAINIEQPFNIGDAIELENGVLGRVVEISWRTTSLQLYTDTLLIIPNGQISSMQIKNYNRPLQHFRLSLEICLDFAVPTERAFRILTAAAESVSEEPQIDCVGITGYGLKYRILYRVPDLSVYSGVRNQVIVSVMHHLYQAGITPIYPKQEVFLGKIPIQEIGRETNKVELLSRIDLLKTLTHGELETLADQLKSREVQTKETVVQQGEEGNSLFIIEEGLLHVFVRQEDQDADIYVSKMEAGNFFGEISLLTGGKRSATVIAATDCILYEIKKEHIASLLESRPELVHRLSQALAEREMNSNQALQQLNAKEKNDAEERLSQQFLEKMYQFFSFLKG